MRRIGRLAIVMALLAGGVQLWGLREATGQEDGHVLIPGVTWTVDHAAKQIKVTARIDFYTDLGPPPISMIRRIEQAIESAWSHQAFKCYELVVDVVVRAVGSRSEAADDAFDVRLNIDAVEVRSHVVGESGDDFQSDDPGQAVRPARSTGTEHTRWGAYRPANIYAHEFGHLLGLDDSYEDLPGGGSRPKAGAREDMMFHQKFDISPEMVTRAIRRSGQVDESQIRCPITIDAGPTTGDLFLIVIRDIKIHAWACDYDPPTDDPTRRRRPIRFTADVSYGGEFLTRLPTKLQASGKGSWRVKGDLPAPGSSPAESELLELKLGKDVIFSDLFYFIPLPRFDAKNPGHLYLKPVDAFQLNNISTNALFPGPPLYPRMTDGAKECP